MVSLSFLVMDAVLIPLEIPTIISHECDALGGIRGLATIVARINPRDS
jgi:hypothetical protein